MESDILGPTAVVLCKAFRSALWIGPDGNKRPCCRYRSNDPNPCRTCIDEEKVGIRSLREKFEALNDDGKIEYLDLNLSNTCNLSCITCNPYLSSKWAMIEKKEMVGHAPKTDILESNDFTNLKRIKLAGGEPFLIPQYWKLLNRLPQKLSDHLAVTLITNGTQPLTPYRKAILKRYKKLELVVSVDGYGKLNDFLRPKSDFRIIMDFVSEAVQTFPTVVIHSVVSILNSNKIDELKCVLLKLGIECRPKLLATPHYLRKDLLINGLAAEFKKTGEIIKKIEKISDIQFKDVNPERWVEIQNKMKELSKD